MKSFLIITTILFWNLTAIAQPTLSISCESFSPNCLSPEPLNTVTYKVTITGAPDNSWTRKITWEHQPFAEGAVIGSSNNETFSVQWLNEPNNGLKKVKVNVRWTKQGQTTINATPAERSVTVRYIAAIPSINISGGGVSGNYNNNGTVAVPCGTRTLTLTASPPTTNPSSGVVYEWLLPSGWTGSSTTNTINITADAGTNDALVRLRYRRSDTPGFSLIFGLNMDRPQVTTPVTANVSGALSCVGTTANLSVSATNATSYTWSSTGSVGVSPTSGATTTATVNSNGSGTITATADNACMSPKSATSNVAVGAPTLYSITPPNSFNYINGNTIMSVQSDQPCVSYYWRIFGGSGYINPTSGPCSYTYGGTTYNKFNTCYVSTSDFVRVELSSANACGVGQTHTFYLQNGSGYRMTSSNPATGTVSLEFTSEFSAENLKSVELIRDGDLRTSHNFSPTNNQQNAAFRSSRTVSFDVSNLPRGRYYLHTLYKEGKKFSEILILQ